jgi:hypothetical protein
MRASLKNVTGCFVVLAGTFFLTPASATILVLDTAVNPANGHTYMLLDTSNWADAEAAAVSMGGHLVTINDQAEEDWIWSKWGPARALMIGLTDAGHEGTFVWTSGESFTYSNWAPGEPNNGVGYGVGPENYAYIFPNGTAYPGYWNDFTGDPSDAQSPLNGVVELVPEPGVTSILVLGGIASWILRRRVNAWA